MPETATKKAKVLLFPSGEEVEVVRPDGKPPRITLADITKLTQQILARGTELSDLRQANHNIYDINYLPPFKKGEEGGW